MAPTQSMYGMQHTLPRLPIPSLKDSCALYVRSLRPLQTPEEHEKSARLVEEFCSSPLAQSLQQRLVDIDRASPTNWLEDNFWLKKAYLEWRDPLMVNSNWYILGQDDANHPKELLENNGERRSGSFTHFQVRRAAHLISRCLEYKEVLDAEAVPVDMVKGKALCMWQYSRTFSLTRVPLHHCDTLVQHDPATTRHILVLVRDQTFKLQVYKESNGNWSRLSLDEIEQALLAIVEHVLAGEDVQAPIPLLTSWHRDSWAAARNHLLSLDPNHRENTTTIESSLFAVALDDNANGADPASWTRTAFCGHQGLGNGHNRWYDKSFTAIVESNGKCAISGEHSPADALIVSYIFDYMLKEPCPGPFNIAAVRPTPGQYASFARYFDHLKWTVDDTMHRYLRFAQADADATAALSDSFVYIFRDFGTDWIKKVGKVSPDAFYQMVLQLAYYRLHKKVTATYETGSTRKYLHGRTDTIRTCSVDTKALVEAWHDPKTDSKTKYALLSKAANSHRQYTQIASEGAACDRHLLVLRLLNSDHRMLDPATGNYAPVPMHPMFLDPIHTESQTWRLSTSGLHAGIRLMGTGFGTVYPDGYGVNYMAAPTLVKFGIEVKRVPETVSAKAFGETLGQIMRELRAVCEEVNGKPASKI